MGVKDDVADIVKVALRSAEDHLHRWRMQFRGMSDDDLDKKYDESGNSCRIILSDHEDDQQRLTECLKWVESQGE